MSIRVATGTSTRATNICGCASKMLHVDYETASGKGNARGLATGSLFKLTGYPRKDQNREYLLISTKYKLQSDAFGSSDAAGEGPVFHCKFAALDAKTPYRPPRGHQKGPGPGSPDRHRRGKTTTIEVGASGNKATPTSENDAKDSATGSDATIKFNPDKTGTFSDGIERDPESSLAHEAYHAHEFQTGKAGPTIKDEELRATSAENEHRKAKVLPQRMKYNSWPVATH